MHSHDELKSKYVLLLRMQISDDSHFHPSSFQFLFYFIFVQS